MDEEFEVIRVNEVRVAVIRDEPDRAVLIFNGEHHFEMGVADLKGLAKRLASDAKFLLN